MSETVVFVLTTSESEDDVRSAYRQHIAGYLVKSTSSIAAELVDQYIAANQFPPVE